MKITQFLKEVRQEMGKVVWPTRGEVGRLTLVVIAISGVVGIYITTLDYLFGRLVSSLVRGG